LLELHRDVPHRSGRSSGQRGTIADHGALIAMARRILIVEDEPIVALNYASILADEGYDVVGPINIIGKGIAAVNREHLDGAVLDIDIAGVPVDPIVAALRQAHIPYIFVSAFSTGSDLMQMRCCWTSRAQPYNS
jgi:CheY-like chemotaxis protein